MTWYTEDGTREVNQIRLGKEAAFEVRNPQRPSGTQLPGESGLVVPKYVKQIQHGKEVTILAPVTVKELLALGVDITTLVSKRPANARPARVVPPHIVKRPGETPQELNERRYAEGIGRLLGGIANARRERTAA